MYRLCSLRSVRLNVRFLSNTATARDRNHYDSLGITPKATQADVKGAYYKLSKLYHPDRNMGCEGTAQKFRDITEAYEVLGNVRLRRLYDKGVSHIGVSTSYEHPSTTFYKSREHRTRPPTTGKTPIYDFDEWSRAHYGATFARDMARKKHIQFHRKVVDNDLQAFQFLFTLGVLFIIMSYISHDSESYDNVSLSNTTSKRN